MISPAAESLHSERPAASNFRARKRRTHQGYSGFRWRYYEGKVLLYLDGNGRGSFPVVYVVYKVFLPSQLKCWWRYKSLNRSALPYLQTNSFQKNYRTPLPRTYSKQIINFRKPTHASGLLRTAFWFPLKRISNWPCRFVNLRAWSSFLAMSKFTDASLRYCSWLPPPEPSWPLVFEYFAISI
jgi:hypothetical protein